MFTALNTAVVGPIPSASVSTAIKANPGLLRSDRTANFRSCILVPASTSDVLMTAPTRTG